ncbi:carcinoembryonic antigen-related cell adhesion molecule 3-like [Diceros bicornis minor]|uniref:carcinoembryonic antigen-related cell adhesion molecule 3-like n=1 Tax=Diceros bicornis minor TaxID=77932 RepID=UPI0026F28E2C|nr:carcinoembryonic antigen-related cell adhesion molecule 3-like [Diceros bicornis minor]
MQSPSATARRGGCVRWQGLLLAVSLLTIWNPPTTARITVKSAPPYAVVGRDILLLVSDLPTYLYSYVWYRADRVDPKRYILSYTIDTSEISPGPGYHGGEKIYPNGSLLLQNVTEEDTGYYTIQAYKKNFKSDEGTAHLHVRPLGSLPLLRVPRGHKDPSHRT